MTRTRRALTLGLLLMQDAVLILAMLTVFAASAQPKAPRLPATIDLVTAP